MLGYSVGHGRRREWSSVDVDNVGFTKCHTVNYSGQQVQQARPSPPLPQPTAPRKTPLPSCWHHLTFTPPPTVRVPRVNDLLVRHRKWLNKWEQYE